MEGILWPVQPLIGIPQCFDDRGRWRAGRETDYLDAAYARAVIAAGGAAVYVPIQACVEAVSDRLDGLLIPGGDDFLPTGTGFESVPFAPVPAVKLDFDERLLAAVTARELPVLAICYGMQLLAICAGGTLHYDIATELPDAANHKLRDPDGRHAVSLIPETRLAKILGPDPGPVNSRHHQSIATPGAGLRVAARAEDGIIEAIEGEGGLFRVGVQWHPETLGGTHRDQLFGVFVAACRGD
jgi:putative glutamine amidotransferase